MKRMILIGLGVVVLVVLLGAAAFIGGRLLNQPALLSAQGDGGLVMKTGQGGLQQGAKLSTIPAKELPQTSAALKGIFVRRADSSVFVGTGQVQMRASKNADGTVSISSSHDGPEVEIVFTHDTTIYRDVTLKQFNGQIPSGDVQLQQVVERGSMDEIGENSSLSVWGDRRGDRVTATTVVYTLPAFLNVKPGAGGGK